MSHTSIVQNVFTTCRETKFIMGKENLAEKNKKYRFNRSNERLIGFPLKRTPKINDLENKKLSNIRNLSISINTYKNI